MRKLQYVVDGVVVNEYSKVVGKEHDIVLTDYNPNAEKENEMFVKHRELLKKGVR